MFGILAIDLRWNDKQISTSGGPGHLLLCATREEATAHAADLTAWYQKDIRSDVVFSAFALPGW